MADESELRACEKICCAGDRALHPRRAEQGLPWPGFPAVMPSRSAVSNGSERRSLGRRKVTNGSCHTSKAVRALLRKDELPLVVTQRHQRAVVVNLLRS